MSSSWVGLRPSQGLQLLGGISLLGLMAALRLYPSFTWPLNSPDEALHLVYPERVMSGAVPNRDFITVSGAAINYAHGLVFELLGYDYRVERALGVLYHLGIASGLFYLLRPLGYFAALLAGTSSLVILEPLGSPAFSYLGGLAFVIWGVALTATRHPQLVFLGGMLGALAMGWRYELLLAVVIASTPQLLDSARLTRFLGGAAVGSLPTLIHLYRAGADTWRNVVLERVSTNFQVAESLIPDYVWVGLAICLTTPLVLCWAAVRSRSAYWASLGGLCAGVLPQALQRVDVPHLLCAAAVVGPILIALGVRTVAVRAPCARQGVRSVSVALIATALITGAVSATRAQTPVTVSHGGRQLPMSNPDTAETVERTLARIQDLGVCRSVFVGAWDMSVPTSNFLAAYILLHEHPINAYYLELLPGVAERPESGLKKDVMGSDLLLLVRVPAGVSRALYPGIGPGSRETNRAVRNNFELMLQDGPFQVWARRDALNAPC